MSLLVQKFGGTSVADVNSMKRVAKRVYKTQQQGNRVVVVVSAMGKTTDNLVALAREVNADPNNREFDMLLSTGEQISVSVLAMALHDLGASAVSMTGPQAGIHTDASHTKAKIMDIKPDRVLEELARGHIVIVAGFQGLNPLQDIATLGRGGSDLSAVALAAALRAERCQIFTDVEGVYTTDPNVVPDARKLNEIAYDEMLELASLGAKVLQSRSVEFAKINNVEIEVLSSFSHAPGTIVKEEVQDMEKVLIRGIALDKSQSKLTVQSLPDKPGVAAALFKVLAHSHINVDMIIQNISEEGHTDISFTVSEDEQESTRKAVQNIVNELGGRGIKISDQKAKVSIVGVGMRTHVGIAHRMFDALAKHQINIDMISTSEIKISVLINREQAEEAVRILHKTFELSASNLSDSGASI